MNRTLLLLLCLTLLPAVPVQASEVEADATDAKMVSGMSIVGNDEAPKALYIVPWKSSEIGVETSLGMMLNESDVPVDREVFMRQMDFYEVSTANARGD